MIELQYLATEFNRQFGADDFEIHLNSNVRPDDSNPRTICTMLAQRVPFALRDVDSETLQLTFTFDLILSDLATRDSRLSIIKNMLGWRSFQVQTPDGEVYNVDSFLEQQPADLPRYDTGVTIQQIVVTGTGLVAAASLGALVSNRIATYIDGVPVKVISAQPGLSKGSDNILDLSGDSTLTEIREISRQPSLQLTLLYMGSSVENTLLHLIEDDSGDELNQLFTVTRVYPAFTSTKQMKLVSGVIIEQAGAYLTYQLVLQKQE